MIAAGSLFTSCVENTEPQGIRDLREAKADYLASLSKLREADAEKVKAEAAVEQAKAEVQKAIAAQNQALAEAQQIANELASIQNEEAAARAKAAIDTIRAKAELDAVKAQQALAEAQAELDKALRKIAAEAIGLTGAEKQAIWEKTYALNIAYASYNNWLCAYNEAAEQLWDAEYDAAAGVKGYETADSYRDSIADQNALIAEANETIASLEALKEHPQAVKDTLDAIDAQIAELTKQIALIVDEKILYEATPGFVAAKAEFAKRVETFEHDSLNVGKFKFVDVDEKGKDVPVVYELTDGLGVDGKFGQLINNAWRENKREGATDYDEIYSYLPKLGFYYNKSIEVGYKYESVEGEWKNPSVVDEPETLEEGLDVLDKIVETLNRELVVVDNIKDSTTIEDAKKAAHIADSTFDAHYAILKGGLKDWKVYKDSVAKLEPLKKKFDEVKGVYAEAAQKLAEDTATVLTNAKTLAGNYKTAIDNFVDQALLFSKKDTAKFISAVNALGAAQAAYLSRQDSVEIVKEHILPTGDPYYYSAVVPFSTLTKAEFKSIEIWYGEGYSFWAVLYAANCYGEPNAESVASVVANQLVPFEFDGKDFAYKPQPNVNKEDTIKWIKNFEFAKKAFDEDVEALKKAVADTVTAYNAVKNFDGDKKAKEQYAEHYKSFWGLKSYEMKDADYKAYPFTWTKKTFLEPENCVEFTYQEIEGKIYANVLKNSALQTILDNVDPDGYNGTKVPNKHRIFKHYEEGSSYNLTEFANALFAAQIVEDLGEYVPNKARLEKINAQVAQIREDVEAAIAEYEEAQSGLDEVYARFYGVDEDGEILPEPNPKALVESNVNVETGKWAFGGYLLEWAEELAPEYPEIVKDVQGKTPVLFGEIAILTNYRNTLDWIFTGYYDFFEDPDHAGWNVEGIIAALDGAIKYQKETVIAGIEIKIAEFEKLVAACEAGYSPAVEKIAPLKQTVDLLKKYLEQAEEALARAQKEYDEVIAQYGVKE